MNRRPYHPPDSPDDQLNPADFDFDMNDVDAITYGNGGIFELLSRVEQFVWNSMDFLYAEDFPESRRVEFLEARRNAQADLRRIEYLLATLHDQMLDI